MSKLLIALLSLALVLSACGQGKKKGPGDTYLVGEELQQRTAPSADELLAIQKVCAALKYARTSFPNDFTGIDFNFVVSNQDCTAPQSSEYDAKALLTSQLVFNSYDSSKQIFTDLVLDDSATFKTICDASNVGSTPALNQIWDAQTKKQFAFSEQNLNSEVFIKIKTAVKSDQGTYLINKIENFTIRVVDQGDPSTKGMTLKRTLTQNCSDKSKTSVFDVAFKSTTTPKP